VSLELEDSDWEFTRFDSVSLEPSGILLGARTGTHRSAPSARHPCAPESIKADKNPKAVPAVIEIPMRLWYSSVLPW
jgi:hypothetical protein